MGSLEDGSAMVVLVVAPGSLEMVVACVCTADGCCVLSVAVGLGSSAAMSSHESTSPPPSTGTVKCNC